jgi:hypothetical protein
MKRLILVVLLVVGCTTEDYPMTRDDCVSACGVGGTGLCYYSAEGSDSVCVCRDEHGNCPWPADAGSE